MNRVMFSLKYGKIERTMWGNARGVTVRNMDYQIVHIHIQMIESCTCVISVTSPTTHLETVER